MADDRFYYRLILADGTILKDCECGYYDKSLWCFLKNITFAEAFQHFSSPNKFGTIIFDIVYKNGVIERFKYSGFDQIISVVQKEFTVDVRIQGANIEIEESKITNEEEVGDV